MRTFGNVINSFDILMSGNQYNVSTVPHYISGVRNDEYRKQYRQITFPEPDEGTNEPDEK